MKKRIQLTVAVICDHQVMLSVYYKALPASGDKSGDILQHYKHSTPTIPPIDDALRFDAVLIRALVGYGKKMLQKKYLKSLLPSFLFMDVKLEISAYRFQNPRQTSSKESNLGLPNT